jgi:serine protease
VTLTTRLRCLTFLLLLGGLVVLTPELTPNTARAADYVPGEVLVGYAPGPVPSLAADAHRLMGVRAAVTSAPDPSAKLIKLPKGMSVASAIKRLRNQVGIAYAVPNLIAHADGIGWIPNDRGRTRRPGGWEKLQWNLLPGAGIDAPWAWANLRRDRRAGGKGVVVAVLDTGIAYRNWRQFRASPDFDRTRFVDPYDFVAHNRFPLDREGHGTFVAGVIAESTNNRIGLTGIAYNAKIMPVRVLDSSGSGDAATIASGIRYAVTHHAQVINLSLEFTPDVTAGEIPDIISAIRFAARRGVTVVAASGNDYVNEIAYPARVPSVISVGATTKDRCLAIYSNGGAGLSLVAPGGGDDKALADDPDCHPERNLPPIYQVTLTNPMNPRRFGIPGNIFGTSMATPHVSATAALVIASGVLGRHPSPDQIRTRLEQTAQPLGGNRPNEEYGWGLLDAGAATARTPAT